MNDHLLKPTEHQLFTIKLIAIYAGSILVLWNIPILKEILWPFKIFTVALHEFGHAIVGIMTGAKIESITLDPNEGGATKMKGGNFYLSLPAGYVGSSFWGALMVFAGFDTLASQIVSCIVGASMLIILFYARNWLARMITVFFVGLIAVLWWYNQSFYLRYFVLFLGVMSCLYSLWDIVEDLISRKVNESDATKYSKLCCRGMIPSQVWGIIWFMISLLFLAAGVIAALIVFKD